MTNIPTITTLYTNILASIENEFGVSVSPIGKVFLRAMAMVQAGKIWLLYLVLGNVQKNVFPDTADPEAQGGTLERAGRLKGLTPFQGTQGQYSVSVTGSAGAAIPAGVTFKSDDSSLNPGFLFSLDTTYVLTGSGDAVMLRSLTTGTSALLAIGNTLTCTQPLVNVNVSVAVTAISISPIDAEIIPTQFRARVLQAFRLQPQGGAAADYRLWTAEVAGVAQSYPYALSGSTDTVAVYAEAIASDSTDGKGTPTTTILNNVATILSAANGLKPLGVMPVQVNPVIIQTVIIAFSGTTGTPGITAAQQLIITNALIAAVSVIRPFIPGTDIITNRNDTISVNTIIQVALNAAPGSYWAGVYLTVAGALVPSYTFDLGNIPWLNPSISYS